MTAQLTPNLPSNLELNAGHTFAKNGVLILSRPSTELNCMPVLFDWTNRIELQFPTTPVSA